MKDEFIVFRKFNDKDSALELGKLITEKKIDNLVEDISIKFDPILSNNEFGKEYCVKLKKIDFERAEQILGEKAENEITEIVNDYYLLSFSNDELIDVISKSDEWNDFDVSLAKKLLRERGNEITEEKINEIKRQRILELSKPEKGQNIYIIIGYLFSLFGGLISIFIGWHLMTFKKTLPNGTKLYAYSENDRKHGNRILILSIIFFVLWILYAILK